MRYSCPFNPIADLQRTVPDMAIDLAGAIASGVVLDTGMIAEHNDIDSPASVIGRVRDVFDAFEAQRNALRAGSQPKPDAPQAAPFVSNSTANPEG